MTDVARRRRVRYCLNSILVVLAGSAISASPAVAHERATNPVISQNSATSNQVDITSDRQYRYITGNGIPDHAHGDYPNASNPNTMAVQQHDFRVPLNPTMANTATPLQRGAFGVALNGVPFDPNAAEYWNRDRQSGWRYEALSGQIDLGIDSENAHVQPNGAYHYHGVPSALSRRSRSGAMAIVGYAADGFPIYAQFGYSEPDNANSDLRVMQSSYRVRAGQRPDGPGGRYDGTFVEDYEYVPQAGDLDECNGRTGVTPEYPTGTYHYFVTDMFPFVPRCFRGTPDDSFLHQPMEAGMGQPPPGNLPPMGDERPGGLPPNSSGNHPPVGGGDRPYGRPPHPPGNHPPGAPPQH